MSYEAKRGCVSRIGQLAGLAGVLVAAACGGDDESAAAPATEVPAEGGAPLPAELPPAPAPPDVDGKVTEGVFVSATHGDDKAEGSPIAPVKTLATAIKLAKERGQAVNACADTYRESVKLVAGVTMYGYFDCAGAEWKRVSNKRSVILAPASPGVLAEGIELPVRFEGFDVTVPDITGKPVGANAAASSYAMIIRSSKNLSLAEITLRAGAGQEGVDGTNPAQNNTDSGAPHGIDARGQRECLDPLETCLSPPPFRRDRQNGSAGGTSTCRVGGSGGPGGQGGDGPIWDNNVARAAIGFAGNGRPQLGLPQTGPGYPRQEPGVAWVGPRAGNVGGDGPSGRNGAWSFTATGFVPGNGTAGSVGSPGQGGGGGSGADYYYGWSGVTYVIMTVPPGTHMGLSGAGGGAGGCGGLPGTGGGGGGASVALFIAASDHISIAKAQLETKKGGRGGRGAIGLAGLVGGNPGRGWWKGAGDPRVLGVYGGIGGAGGAGGHGGLSGHGATGPSIPLVFSGTKPELFDVKLVPGQAGDVAQTTTWGAQTMTAPAAVAKNEHAF